MHAPQNTPTKTENSIVLPAWLSRAVNLLVKQSPALVIVAFTAWVFFLIAQQLFSDYKASIEKRIESLEQTQTFLQGQIRDCQQDREDKVLQGIEELKADVRRIGNK